MFSKFNKKNTTKQGITLITLVITIIVSLILVSALMVDLNFNIKEAKLSKFVYNISNLEDALKSYYILNEELPKNSEVLTIETLQTYQSDNELYIEISKNMDENSELYFLDLDKIEVEKKEEIEEDWDKYIFSYPNFNVYYLEGEKINGVKYFSITDKVDEKILKKYNENIDNSVISVEEGTAFNVTYDGSNFKNKLDIVTEYDSSKYTLDMVVTDSSNNVKSFSKTSGEKSFEKATDIDSTLSNTSIEKIVFKLKDNEENIIAKEVINTSNYDPIAPTVSYDKTVEYTDIKIATFNVSDTGKSGLKEVHYEYLVDNNEKDLEYMKTQAKVIDATDIYNNKVSIKIPNSDYGLQVLVIDKAGNSTSYVKK